MTNFDYIGVAKKVLEIESKALAKQIDHIDEAFIEACELCLECTGKLIVMGLGKSGHIADKIAATLSSTGTPSYFIHPSEAIHGDLGMIDEKDIVLIFSYSGETEEIVSLIPYLKKKEIKILAFTGNADSKLSQESDVHIHVPVEEEACPMNLAPTASTTTALAVGDAFAVALLERKGFTKEDFAKSHPGGSLGKQLLLTINDIMHTEDEIPVVYSNDTLARGLIEMSQKALGMTTVVDQNNQLVGIFTDGDLRRTLESNIDIQATEMSEVMTANPFVLSADTLAYNAVSLIQEKKITSIIVAKENKVIGALNIHDLFRAGLM
ncbi:MAG: D-arabinose 5-phosphate isomerase [Gammaproteobacteria bacterium]|nr:D-arabinose 5-phosphate isomerase [Gammaproteobacteria bacterium]MBQ09038.1 D-arabinose 5-phosphate isomerase [Gammaproteobacteria bacterium]HJL79963.1 KpsF/GutQ family sugar-phosphate isomerase [Gammaproteobacteria bacterium]HJM08835.1 KpsF/GutQ family sugar-phosphate isomerase [Gammaproteobacteria bacterium]|tara:strand:+ start:14250 stop:15218 length:969 start_codon:yes stop_codon:yes gene_type:complete